MTGRSTSWTGLAVLLGLALLLIAGCWPHITTPVIPKVPVDEAGIAALVGDSGMSKEETLMLRSLDYFAGCMIAVGLFCMIAFVVSLVVPLIPRTSTLVAAGASVGSAIAVWWIKSLLARFFIASVWIGGGCLLALAVVLIWPWARTGVNLWLEWSGRRMKRAGHNSGGTALMAKARGWTKPRHAEKRKALLET